MNSLDKQASIDPTIFKSYVDKLAHTSYLKVDKNNGNIVTVRWFAYYFEKFKGLLGFCDWANKSLVQIQAIELIERNKGANLALITTLAKRVGLITANEQPKDITELTGRIFKEIFKDSPNEAQKNIPEQSLRELYLKSHSKDLKKFTPFFQHAQQSKQHAVPALMNKVVYQNDVGIPQTSVNVVQKTTETAMPIEHNQQKKEEDQLCKADLQIENGIKYLVENNSDIVDPSQKTEKHPFLNVVSLTTPSDAATLLLKYGPDFINQAPEKALIEGNSDILEYLLKYGAKPDQKDEFGLTLLVKAILSDNLEAAKLLLKYKADPNHEAMPGKSLLAFVCNIPGKEPFAKILLEHGANPNTTVKGISLLESACVNERLDIVKLLLEQGADPNQLTNCGFLLHKVSTLGQLEIVKLLVEHGARVSAKDFYGNTPQIVAKLMCKGKWQKVSTFLSQHMPKDTQVYSNEYMRRVFLGHVFEYDYRSDIVLNNGKNLGTVVSWGGQYAFFTHKIAKSIPVFFNFVPQFKTEGMQKAGQAFRQATEPFNADALFKTWESGSPVIVHSGYETHYVGVVFLKNRVVLCDRSGDYSTSRNCLFYEFESKEMNPKIFEKIHRLLEGNKENYVLKIVELFNQIDCTPLYLGKSLLDNQNARNCAWANQEAALLTLLILFESESHPDQRMDDLIEKQLEIFKNWKAFQQCLVVHKYLEKIDFSAEEVRPDYATLIHVLLEGLSLKGLHPKIQEEWLRAEQVFLAKVPKEIKEDYAGQKKYGVVVHTIMRTVGKIISLPRKIPSLFI